ncbi:MULTISPECIES: hypothetical protein [unclassified Mesorhizobium]|uniref:hypothetical protein n=1 Tax=unclassified Mesorhizobium TaxID=325217 RepID=UPI003335F05D
MEPNWHHIQINSIAAGTKQEQNVATSTKLPIGAAARRMTWLLPLLKISHKVFFISEKNPIVSFFL